MAAEAVRASETFHAMMSFISLSICFSRLCFMTGSFAWTCCFAVCMRSKRSVPYWFVEPPQFAMASDRAPAVFREVHGTQVGGGRARATWGTLTAATSLLFLARQQRCDRPSPYPHLRHKYHEPDGRNHTINTQTSLIMCQIPGPGKQRPRHATRKSINTTRRT